MIHPILPFNKINYELDKVDKMVLGWDLGWDYGLGWEWGWGWDWGSFGFLTFFWDWNKFCFDNKNTFVAEQR